VDFVHCCCISPLQGLGLFFRVVEGYCLHGTFGYGYMDVGFDGRNLFLSLIHRPSMTNRIMISGLRPLLVYFAPSGLNIYSCGRWLASIHTLHKLMVAGILVSTGGFIAEQEFIVRRWRILM